MDLVWLQVCFFIAFYASLISERAKDVNAPAAEKRQRQCPRQNVMQSNVIELLLC